tara:strand:+ start:2154 stop:3308 length:1155 start_codon:yes stop_codon:yes gene_type:complete
MKLENYKSKKMIIKAGFNQEADYDIERCENCKFKYSFGNADCTLANNGIALFLFTNHINSDITYGSMGKLGVGYTLITANPIVDYGDSYSGNILIQLKGSGGSIDLVIPYKSTNSERLSSKSMEFFNEILLEETIPMYGKTKKVNVSSTFSLDSIIPHSSYYVLEGSYQGNTTKNDRIIIFNKYIHMSNKQYNLLKKRLGSDYKRVNINTARPEVLVNTDSGNLKNKDEPKFLFDKEGTKQTSNIAQDNMVCQEVEIDENGEEVTKSDLNKKYEAPKMDIPWRKIIIIVLSLLALIIGYFIWKYVISKTLTKGQNAVDSWENVKPPLVKQMKSHEDEMMTKILDTARLEATKVAEQYFKGNPSAVDQEVQKQIMGDILDTLNSS